MDDGEAVAGAGVEGVALDGAAGAAVADKGAQFRNSRRHFVGVANHFHGVRLHIDEIVERQHRENGARGIRDRHAIKADQPLGIRRARKIGIHNRNVVTMAHGAQRVEEIRRKQRVDIDEHRVFPWLLLLLGEIGAAGLASEVRHSVPAVFVCIFKIDCHPYPDNSRGKRAGRSSADMGFPVASLHWWSRLDMTIQIAVR